MGDPKKLRKKFAKPKRPYEKERIEDENRLVKEYGLKNKKEVWKANSKVRRWRFIARQLQADKTNKRETRFNELMNTLKKYALADESTTLDDVLTLSVTDLLSRRLQSVVYKKGLANTQKQARQFIVHGKIAVDGKKVTAPSYLVTTMDESKIGYYGKPPEFEKKANEAAEASVEAVAVPKAPSTKPTVPTTKPTVPSTKPSVPEVKE
jgi:small subunit ribosomal protein S4